MILTEPCPDRIAELAAIAGGGGACLAPADPAAAPYLAEPRDRWRGRAAAILRPKTTAQVAEIVRHCARHRIGIVPYAGGTGLVAGQIREDVPAPVVLALDRMTRIRAVLLEDAALIAEAGAVLADIRAAAAAAGRLFPLSMASEGSCRIGGNLATNAGGVQVLRYGNARDLCLGIEAVMADGAVLEGLKPLRKDNAGYDLRHLLIGSEGTLGVITAAALRLYPSPGETVTAMLAVPAPADAVALLHDLHERLGDAVTGFELISGTGIGFLRHYHPDRPDPVAGDPPWRVLVEATGPAESGLAERTEAAIAAAFETGLATDGALAASEAQRAHMWWIRETIPECNRGIGAVSSHDIAVPISRIARFIEDGAAAVAVVDPGLRINCFGHIGDGNLHYNVFPAEGRSRADYEALRPAVKRAVHDCVAAHDGSIAAEHGIGRLKTADLVQYGDSAKLAAMRAIKAALDPRGILNPGALFGR